MRRPVDDCDSVFVAILPPHSINRGNAARRRIGNYHRIEPLTNNMTRPRLARWLRITWTAFWALAAALVIVLWVRSYWRWDAITLPVVNNCGISLKSFEGRIVIKKTTISDARFWPVGFESLNFDNHQVVLAEKYHVQSYAGPLVAKNAVVATLSQLPLVLTAAVFAVAPWIGWPNRFSLRTLLIATTLIAVALGTIIVLSR